jgi:hypothetical protein
MVQSVQNNPSINIIKPEYLKKEIDVTSNYHYLELNLQLYNRGQIPYSKTVKGIITRDFNADNTSLKKG